MVKEPWYWKLEDRKAMVVEGRCIRIKWSPRLGFEITPGKQQIYHIADRINEKGEINVHLWVKKWNIRDNFLRDYKSPAKETRAINPGYRS